MIVQKSLLGKKNQNIILLITIYQYVKLATSPQEAYGNAKDTIFNNKVNLNYILILDPD